MELAEIGILFELADQRCLPFQRLVAGRVGGLSPWIWLASVRRLRQQRWRDQGAHVDRAHVGGLEAVRCLVMMQHLPLVVLIHVAWRVVRNLFEPSIEVLLVLARLRLHHRV